MQLADTLDRGDGERHILVARILVLVFLIYSCTTRANTNTPDTVMAGAKLADLEMQEKKTKTLRRARTSAALTTTTLRTRIEMNENNERGGEREITCVHDFPRFFLQKLSVSSHLLSTSLFSLDLGSPLEGRA